MSEAPRPPYVQFEVRSVEDRAQSVEQGRAAFRDEIFAIVTPAGTRDKIEKVASDWIESIREGVKQERIPGEWERIYSEALERFKASKENPEFGTAIRDWPSVTPAQLATLQAAAIRTVEELAEATEEAVNRLGMGGRALREKAKSWLATSENTGKVAEENAVMRQELEELRDRDGKREKEVAELRAMLDNLTGKNNKTKVPATADED